MENTFGGFLRQKRREKNLTQKELSKLLFVSESTVSKWEKGIPRQMRTADWLPSCFP